MSTYEFIAGFFLWSVVLSSVYLGIDWGTHTCVELLPPPNLEDM